MIQEGAQTVLSFRLHPIHSVPPPHQHCHWPSHLVVLPRRPKLSPPSFRLQSLHTCPLPNHCPASHVINAASHTKLYEHIIAPCPFYPINPPDCFYCYQNFCFKLLFWTLVFNFVLNYCFKLLFSTLFSTIVIINCLKVKSGFVQTFLPLSNVLRFPLPCILPRSMCNPPVHKWNFPSAKGVGRGGDNPLADLPSILSFWHHTLLICVDIKDCTEITCHSGLHFNATTVRAFTLMYNSPLGVHFTYTDCVLIQFMIAIGVDDDHDEKKTWFWWRFSWAVSEGQWYLSVMAARGQWRKIDIPVWYHSPTQPIKALHTFQFWALAITIFALQSSSSSSPC